MSGRPSRRVDEDSDAVEHDADRYRVVRSARAGQRTVQMGVEQQRVLLPGRSAVRYADNDVGEV